MAYTILWMDGFDEIGDASQKYTVGGEISPSQGTSTNNTPFLWEIPEFNNSARAILQKVIPGAPYTVFFVGFHFLINSTDTVERNFIQFLDAQNNVVQIELRRIWDNVLLKHVLRLYRGSTLLATTSDGIPQNTWTMAQREARLQPDQRGGGGKDQQRNRAHLHRKHTERSRQPGASSGDPQLEVPLNPGEF
jgi:hypothetical protein